MSRNSKERGKISWQSPSNIALIKYWGKHGNQLPCNPSLSMSLNSSVTTTSLSYNYIEKDKNVNLEFLFNGKRSLLFEKRVSNYLNNLLKEYPFLADYHLIIDSNNTFPHSSGIASSASAFSALALCIISLKEICQGDMNQKEFFQEASNLARLGSGSASRSVYGGYTIWGKVEGFNNYSDEYASPLKSTIHPVFQTFYDAILIVSGENKKVGSSAGHFLMEKHPYAKSRYQQAMNHTIEMIHVLETGDLERFIEIVENEALTLHGLMMSSDPGYILIKSETIEIIERIRNFRQTQKIPVTFTLDAGPNVHILYPESYRKEVIKFIEDELVVLCDAGQWIDDSTGRGPKLLNIQ